jgi:hypothetical protein
VFKSSQNTAIVADATGTAAMISPCYAGKQAEIKYMFDTIDL